LLRLLKSNWGTIWRALQSLVWWQCAVYTRACSQFEFRTVLMMLAKQLSSSSMGQEVASKVRKKETAKLAECTQRKRYELILRCIFFANPTVLRDCDSFAYHVVKILLRQPLSC